MKRLAMSQLESWKLSSRRKPLIVSGARQVGKTWLMKEFGHRSFERVAYVTFDNNPRMPEVFQGSLSPSRLIPILQAEAEVRIDEGTLLILDEIQEVPRALQSLKYFCEEAPRIPVIAAGSSLGLALKDGRRSGNDHDSAPERRASFPVGKVSFLDLYPLSFIEFLEAIGREQLVQSVQELDWDVLGAFHDELIELVRTYFYVGGMPEAVAEYASSQDWFEVRRIQEELLRSYEADFSKHTSGALAERIRLVWRAIAPNLAKENRKFMFSKIKSSARARDYEDALQWLKDSSLVHRVTCVSAPQVPLMSHADASVFKVFCHDIGLLGAMNHLDARTLLEGETLFSSFRGALAEQYVLQEILASGQVGEPHYLRNESTHTEIDFIVDANRLSPDALPVEVKYGNNLRAKSLAAYVKKWDPAKALRISSARHATDGVIEEVPFYALGPYFRENVTDLH